jgi:hypothetical protein
VQDTSLENFYPDVLKLSGSDLFLILCHFLVDLSLDPEVSRSVMGDSSETKTE